MSEDGIFCNLFSANQFQTSRNMIPKEEERSRFAVSPLFLCSFTFTYKRKIWERRIDFWVLSSILVKGLQGKRLKEGDFLKHNVETMLKLFSQVRKIYINELCRSFNDESLSPSEINILIFLANNPSMNTNKELGICLGVSKGLISRGIDSLLKKHYITILSDTNDRRVRRLLLTEEATPLLKKVENLRAEIEAKILHDISQNELTQMQNTLNKIGEHFQNWERGKYTDETQHVERG